MNTFLAVVVDGPRDGMLCVISKGVYIKDLEDLHLTTLDGKTAAMFTLTTNGGERTTYRTLYPTVVRAAKNQHPYYIRAILRRVTTLGGRMEPRGRFLHVEYPEGALTAADRRVLMREKYFILAALEGGRGS